MQREVLIEVTYSADYRLTTYYRSLNGLLEILVTLTRESI